MSQSLCFLKMPDADSFFLLLAIKFTLGVSLNNNNIDTILSTQLMAGPGSGLCGHSLT